MRKIISLIILLCFVFGATAKPVFSNSVLQHIAALGFIATPQSEIAPGQSVERKMTLKERVLIRLFQKRILKKADEASQKKLINKLGLFSLITSILGIVTLLSIFLIGEVAVIIYIFFVMASLILGFIVLNKRKKLTDKTGVHKTIPWIGIILSLLGLALFLIAVISLSVNGWS